YESVSRERIRRLIFGFVAPYQCINQLSWKRPFHPVQSAQTSPTQGNLKHEEKSMKQEQRSVKEVHSELGMHSVRFAKDEQGRRKEQQVLFKWPEVQKKLGEHKHIYVVDARLGSNNYTHRLWYAVIQPHAEEDQDWRTLGHHQ